VPHHTEIAVNGRYQGTERGQARGYRLESKLMN
jgi:hypothetical protein